MKAAMKAAFPFTLPILTGFLVLGMAFGILMQAKGLHIGWAMLLSMATFAGSMQFVAVPLLCATFQPLHVFLLTLLVNARHLFYGISMLEKFRDTGKYKGFLIFSLCDETFSILSSVTPPKHVDKTKFMFSISFLNYCYWWIGTLLGLLVGKVINIQTEGIDFVLTALFVVIFLNQWERLDHHTIPLLGIMSALLALLMFGKEQFLIPTMIFLLLGIQLLKSTSRMKIPYE